MLKVKSVVSKTIDMYVLKELEKLLPIREKANKEMARLYLEQADEFTDAELKEFRLYFKFDDVLPIALSSEVIVLIETSKLSVAEDAHRTISILLSNKIKLPKKIPVRQDENSGINRFNADLSEVWEEAEEKILYEVERVLNIASSLGKFIDYCESEEQFFMLIPEMVKYKEMLQENTEVKEKFRLAEELRNSIRGVR